MYTLKMIIYSCWLICTNVMPELKPVVDFTHVTKQECEVAAKQLWNLEAQYICVRDKE